MIKRVILIVLDSFGVGALPDASKFFNDGQTDEKADTFGHIADKYTELHIPNLQKLGLGNITGAAGGRFAITNLLGSFGRLAEMSVGKDTTTGHWEIAGLYTDKPFKTYPEGFPEEFIRKFEKAIGTKVIGNYPASGTVIIEELGPEHEATGRPIVYTSADSVFQIAACEEVVPLERLYKICMTAREMLVGDVSCIRVIARPYTIRNGKRVRTSERRDYSVMPPRNTLLDNLIEADRQVFAIGKIHDIFNGKGLTQSVHTEDNTDGINKTIEAIKTDFDGLIFTNLVDFDTKYGHRRDPSGYGKAINAFDSRLPDIMHAMKKSDVLMLCADHGNDPTYSGFDHTREYIPILVYGEHIKKGHDLGTRAAYADIGATIAEMLGAAQCEIGESFMKEVLI